jgi:hypothetical protein
MENGAIIRKHPIDAILLCSLICISFFAASPSYSTLYYDGYDSPDGKWSACTYYDDSSTYAIIVERYTLIWPAGYADYDTAQVTTTITFPDGTTGTYSDCHFPKASLTSMLPEFLVFITMHQTTTLGWEAVPALGSMQPRLP